MRTWLIFTTKCSSPHQLKTYYIQINSQSNLFEIIYYIGKEKLRVIKNWYTLEQKPLYIVFHQYLNIFGGNISLLLHIFKVQKIFFIENCVRIIKLQKIYSWERDISAYGSIPNMTWFHKYKRYGNYFVKVFSSMDKKA